MNDLIKQILYISVVLILGNSVVILLLLVHLLSAGMNGLLTLVISLLMVCVYHIKIWLPLRGEFHNLDDKCCRFLYKQRGK